MTSLALLNDQTGIRHRFFSREGGVSDGLYASLNCGYGSGDAADRVRENRGRALARLGLAEDNLSTLYQVHSPQVVVVEEPWATGEAPRADAMVTRRRGHALGILTADCVPVLFADPKARVIGAAHAGWKGALTGVLQATIAAMVDLGAARESILAAVGPAIAHRSYEVGPGFPDPFLEADPGNDDFFLPAPRDGHFHFDIKGFVARTLGRAGVTQVAVSPADTYSDAARYFSYRRSCHRGEDDYGRLLSVILLEA